MGLRGALTTGLLVSLAFAVLACVNLESQGLYYDELHQAPASFNYLGKRAPHFNYNVRGIPILNMTYSGALKSHVYGLYLRFLNPHFTVYSWRLLGILFVVGGLMAFYALTAGALPFAAAALFGALMLTDASFLLTTRHDWGPTALAFCLRLVFLALWLSSELGRPARWKYVAAGFIAGLAIFEKLSSVVLLAPLALLMLTSLRVPRCWLAALLGFAIGSLPLIVVNTMLGFGPISFSHVAGDGISFDLQPAMTFAYRYLALGQGDVSRQWILGESSSAFWIRSEALLTALLALIVSVAAFQRRSSSRPMTLGGVLIAAYVLIGMALWMFPRDTFVHHWVLGTPFQYGAFALAFPVFTDRTHTYARGAAVLRVAFLGALAMLIALRAVNLVGVERSLAAGQSARRFDPALTRLAEIAASRSRDAAFVAADWGTGTQVFCIGDGQDDLIYEPFWDRDPGASVRIIAEATRKDTLYVLRTGIAPQYLAASETILQSLANAPGWREVPVESALADLPPIQVRKFVRTPFRM